MPLSPGDRLGPYEILSPLGAGGMGEVWKARDTRLDRTVAVKVLPKYIADRDDLRARFEREARAVASLNHPNICVLYDIGKQDGIDFMVLEHLAGETLAARVAKGPMPFDQVLKYATRIADALDRAHRSGVCHRDVKPANIMVTRDGVKVLDFGLAKTARTAGPEDLTGLATLTSEGTLLGTPQYMAPEQYEGREADARSDIFAFGCVVYEMVTGKRCFEAKTQASLIAAVLTADPPPMRAIQPVTPAALERLVKRCLAKDPEDRYQSMRDVVLELLAIAESGDDLPAQAVGQPRKRRGLAWAAATCVVPLATSLAALALVHFREEPPRLVKLSLLPPEKARISGVPALSPDGRHLAFAATHDGKSELWVRDLDSLTSRPLPGTEGGSSPFWSPDSRSLAFFADKTLKRIAVAGGPALTLCDVSTRSYLGGTWGRNDDIVFASFGLGEFRISAAGGAATALSGEFSGLRDSRWFLPDGRHFLYTVSGDPEKKGIYVRDIDSKGDSTHPRRVLPGGAGAVYAPPGYLLFLSGSTLMAQPFDADKAQPTGEAMAVAEQVRAFSASQNGAVAYLSGGSVGTEVQLGWVDRSGKAAATVGPPGDYSNFRLSPDEKRIAFDRIDASGNWDVWVMDLIRGTTSRLTSDPGIDNLPIWSPDGLRVLYPNNRSGVFDLYARSASGAGQEEVLVKLGTITGWGTHWSRDGRFILYEIPGAGTGEDLWVGPRFGDQKPFPYLRTKFNESDGSFSPDGRWVAYVSDESGRSEIYVQAFPLSGAKTQISTEGGAEPNWRKDGAELFYRAADGNLTAVPVRFGATLEAGAPKSLFPVTPMARNHSFAASNDGQRFLVGASAGGKQVDQITVVLNWQAGLKK